jgi:hypothetical protein
LSAARTAFIRLDWVRDFNRRKHMDRELVGVRKKAATKSTPLSISRAIIATFRERRSNRAITRMAFMIRPVVSAIAN